MVSHHKEFRVSHKKFFFSRIITLNEGKFTNCRVTAAYGGTIERHFRFRKTFQNHSFLLRKPHGKITETRKSIYQIFPERSSFSSNLHVRFITPLRIHIFCNLLGIAREKFCSKCVSWIGKGFRNVILSDPIIGI